MRQSKRRMLVAARRIHNREDILQRRPVRYRWPKRRPQLILEGFTPYGAMELVEMLMRRDNQV